MVGTKDQNLIRECPACDSKRHLSRGRKADYEVLCCQECGSLFTSTLPVISQAPDYNNYYSAENLSVPDFIHLRLQEIVASFSAYRRQNRLLEIGFGAGAFLEAAVRAGWNVEGVEVSKSAVDHARAAGFKTFLGELSEARFDDGSFDVVIASELLEHIPDPRSTLCEVARILRPGGLFWATTPNAKGLSPRLLGLKWSVICPPEHLHLLTENGLRKLLRSAGFRCAGVITEGTNPFELLQKFRTQSSKGDTVGPSNGGCERVKTGYRLNEALMKNPSRRALKNFVNGILRLSHLGDSLKVMAVR